MPIVSDASPLILLAKIERLDLLKKLYQEIIIPSQVRDEIARYNDDASRIILANENRWIKIKDVEFSPQYNRIVDKLGLHKGEMYALNLAVNLNFKEILADDKIARIAARMLGLRAIGCLGVVMKAYEIRIITRNDAIESIKKLVKSGLWLSPEVLVEVFNDIENR